MFLTALPLLNQAPKNPWQSGLDLCAELPTKPRRHMYYVYPYVLAEVFLDDIEQVLENAKKSNLEAIQ